MKPLFKIVLSPIALVWGLLFTSCMCFFPIPIIMIMSFMALLRQPFVWLLNLVSSEKIEPIDALFEVSRYTSLNHFFSITLPIWLPIYITAYFIKFGELFTGESKKWC